MHISLAWLNRFLDAPDVTPEEADRVLTDAGFPIEERRDLPGGDVFLDVEITSNRGDCLSHAGLAREITACAHAGKPRRLVMPPGELPGSAGDGPEPFTLINNAPEACPRFTAQRINGVKVGPSPEWLVRDLEAVGQRSISNVVNITNWLTLGLGHPSHVFDAKKLAGDRLEIRWAREGEPLTTLDGATRKLRADELVVADAQQAQSLAGVIGGKDSEVTSETTDIVLEVACWDPVTIRRAARRLQIRTDASHRFERGVDPRTLDEPARIAARMILDLAGGKLVGGLLDEGPGLPAPTIITLRPRRATTILGVETEPASIRALLLPLGIETEPASDGSLRCVIPPFRPDLTREIDLIEEIARLRGLVAIPLKTKIELEPRSPQTAERALREVNDLLAAMGFYETVTFSFVSPRAAQPWLASGLSRVDTDDERRGAEPTLRPSVLPSLLACRRANQDAQVRRDGGVRLFERSAVFAQEGEGEGASSVERRTLTLLMDAPGSGAKRSHEDLQRGLRLMRGAIEAVIRATSGPASCVECLPCEPPCAGWDAGAHAEIRFSSGRQRLLAGRMGLIDARQLGEYDLSTPVIGAELEIDTLLACYPPRGAIRPLPAFPHTERDVSLILPEATPWGDVASLVHAMNLNRLEAIEHAGVFRGQQIGAGRKSLTVRLRFRDPDRTLRREEVDPEIDRLIEKCRNDLKAEIRAT